MCRGREKATRKSIVKLVKETLQERFQQRSRFSRARMPNIPVIVEKPTRLEASLPVPPRKPRNVARKRAAKKCKITETTS
jgi:chromatin segregation and condensation protein Rec8/ScpA/Scc1 (kleisin family)